MPWITGTPTIPGIYDSSSAVVLDRVDKYAGLRLSLRVKVIPGASHLPSAAIAITVIWQRSLGW